MESTAKLFINGRSQAVRLPKDFRFSGTEVIIKKEGQRVILEPMRNTKWPDNYFSNFSLDKTFEVPAPLPKKPFDLDD